ncbi:phospholipid/glycerol acyltransferase [Shewanella halifaxensis HAW-EB4]|uniref:Phospholipid/glycerol acyltransferase n=1 Tax=Shewanella halifaxensis (strain HAW-EB4) TaxID=458817 RepID=B0TJT4_SHEHH|nr:acyltransferase [Shewanella halifaxensis]ABZ78502.1 phospholipid/glycerol acyltransferase [Shewanella halifaxensis HAW-EB4]
MLNFLPGPVLYFLSTLFLIINTVLWASLISVGGIIKLLLPITVVRIGLTHVMNRFMWAWATCNGGILYLLADIEWDIKGLDNLDKKSWYLLISNHLSGFDIAVQTYVLRNHIPMLKFFLKKELMYVPFLGLGCWALDMPFMTRTSPAKLKKNPKLKGKDLHSTRRACKKFRNMPTSIINYVEGSRFTGEKHARQDSPYRYLLRPKAGGIAFALSAMGEQFTNVLDITVLYPDVFKKDALYEVMHGRMKKIVVRVKVLPVPEVDNKRYFSEAAYRVEFQRWLNDLWENKDEEIHHLMLKHNPSSEHIVHKPSDSDNQ